MGSSFKLLARKDIIAILDGDTTIEEKSEYDVRLPYLSGTKLAGICSMFGYLEDLEKVSRWVYLDNLIKYLDEKNKCDELLSYLFKKEHFEHLTKLSKLSDIEEAYNYSVEAIIDKINVILYMSGYELNMSNNRFYMCEKEKKPIVDAPNINLINMDYIHGLRERCRSDFIAGNYDSVITKSRTLVEEVLIYILESNKIQVESKGDINKIYNQVKEVYHMRQNREFDGRVNSMLSGLEKIIQAIAEMRNSNSDAHGVGRSRIKIREREARLIMNSSESFCEYVLAMYLSHK